jgi:hypothetical protein
MSVVIVSEFAYSRDPFDPVHVFGNCIPLTFINLMTFSWFILRASSTTLKKCKGIPLQAEVALGVPGRLRPRFIMAFGTTRVVDRQPNAPAAFTLGEIPSTHFQRLSRPQGTWFCRKEPRKKSQVTPLRIDPGTSD